MKNMNQKSIVSGFEILSILAFLVFLIPTSASALGGKNITYGTFNSGYEAPKHAVIASNPRPIITDINPEGAVSNAGPVTITVIGTGFIPSSMGRVNNTDRRTNVIDANHLMIETIPSDMYLKDGFYITVVNPAPDGGISNSAFFKVKYAPIALPQNSNSGQSAVSYYPNNNSYAQAPGQYQNNTGLAYYPAASGNMNEGNIYGPSDFAANVIYGKNTFLPSGIIQWVLFAILILLIIIIVRRVSGAKDHYHSTPMKHD